MNPMRLIVFLVAGVAGAVGAVGVAGVAGAAGGRLPAAVATEMAEAVVAVDKALGLESWPVHGAKPCVDHGGADHPTQTVKPEDARKCATAAVEKSFPELGKSYVLAVLMSAIGPVTVMAVGIGEGDGWAAYSCDPGRKCAPVRMEAINKWGKRVVERRAKACADTATFWLPAGKPACPSADKK